jgi:hypothetical protein
MTTDKMCSGSLTYAAACIIIVAILMNPLCARVTSAVDTISVIVDSIEIEAEICVFAMYTANSGVTEC